MASAIGHKGHRNLQHTVESVLPAPTSACCAHSTEGALGRDRLGYSPADDGFHAIPARVGEGRQRRCLGNVLQANNCVPDLLSRSWQVFLR